MQHNPAINAPKRSSLDSSWRIYANFCYYWRIKHWNPFKLLARHKFASPKYMALRNSCDLLGNSDSCWSNLPKKRNQSERALLPQIVCLSYFDPCMSNFVDFWPLLWVSNYDIKSCLCAQQCSRAVYCGDKCDLFRNKMRQIGIHWDCFCDWGLRMHDAWSISWTDGWSSKLFNDLHCLFWECNFRCLVLFNERQKCEISPNMSASFRDERSQFCDLRTTRQIYRPHWIGPILVNWPRKWLSWLPRQRFSLFRLRAFWDLCGVFWISRLRNMPPLLLASHNQ